MSDASNQPQILSEAAKAEIRAVMGNYPEARAAVLPALWIAQREHGWVSPALGDQVADTIGIPAVWVHEVLSFYVLFHKQPVGKHVIWMCRSLSCQLRGFPELKAHLEAKLGIREGETTADGMFTLKSNECLGACGGAPMVQIDDAYYENLDAAAVDGVLERIRKATPA
jgi:NADH-quinone oxidoreductase subunit E